MTRILVADDEPGIASAIVKGLRASGFEADAVDDGMAAVEAARDDRYDLLVLDLGLPRKQGLEVLQELRERGEQLPVLVLTARDELETTIATLDAGADDHMTKPFRFEELLARVRARLRKAPTADPMVLRAGGLSLDLRSRRAYIGDRGIDLTSREFALAEAFLRHPDEVLSRERLLDMVWEGEVDATSKVVDVYILYLRRKLGDGVIETVRGHGYRLGSVSEEPKARRPRG